MTQIAKSQQQMHDESKEDGDPIQDLAKTNATKTACQLPFKIHL